MGSAYFHLSRNIRQEIPDVTQAWYADDAGALGMSAILENYSDSLTRQGPGQGYHPDQNKIVLILCPDNFEAEKCLEDVAEFCCAWAHVI